MVYSDELVETFTVPPVMRIHTCKSDANSEHCETQIHCHLNTNKQLNMGQICKNVVHRYVQKPHMKT